MDTAAETVERELTVLVRLVRMRSARAARELDARLDSSAYAALTRIADSGPMRAQELACRIGLDKSTVSRLLAVLSELGLVERVPDPADGRAFLLRLTASGRTRLNAVRGVRRAELQSVLASWPAEDRETFARLLAAFNADSQTELNNEPGNTAAAHDGDQEDEEKKEKEVAGPNGPADRNRLITAEQP